jgi:hypothetical protein
MSKWKQHDGGERPIDPMIFVDAETENDGYLYECAGFLDWSTVKRYRVELDWLDGEWFQAGGKRPVPLRTLVEFCYRTPGSSTPIEKDCGVGYARKIDWRKVTWWRPGDRFKKFGPEHYGKKVFYYGGDALNVTTAEPNDVELRDRWVRLFKESETPERGIEL